MAGGGENFVTTNDMTFTGLLLGVINQSLPLDPFNADPAGYSQFMPHYTPLGNYSTSEIIFESFATLDEHTPYSDSTEQTHAISDSETDSEYPPTDDDSEPNDDNFSQRREKDANSRVPDADIYYYHNGNSFGEFSRDDEEIPPRYDPTTNHLKDMLFDSYELLKHAVAWYPLKGHKQFKTSYKKDCLSLIAHPRSSELEN